jgi:type IV pilus assembly protein PilY1
MIEKFATATRALKCGVAGALLFTAGAAHAQLVSQNPLSAGGNVPGNLFLVPSVEYPTVMSIANIDDYSSATVFVGYFDSYKCYKYFLDPSVEANSYFYPVRKPSPDSTVCNGGSKEWSGNFLNWAATQTIDPFRKALTGGLRTADTATLTILEKARYHDANESLFPTRRVPDTGDSTGTVSGAFPSGTWGHVRTRVARLGNRMFFTSTSGTAMDVMSPEPTVTIYNGQTLDASNEGTIFSVRVRVKVCDSAYLESNCVQYGASTYKPEGLIQKYANRIRFSAFSYLNDSSATRDGGVLRAKQKFVGPQKLDPVAGWMANAAKEWSSVDGTFYQDPDSTDSLATNGVVAAGGAPAAPQTLNNSGVINYINKFGQMTTKNDKSFDPVSEMYYTAIRYLRGMTNLSDYSNLTGSAKERYELADGFPVITTWDDPLQYYCQNNSILGIGDAYTHKDKNLLGYPSGGSQEPASQPDFSPDTVDVTVWANRVAALENLSGTPTFPATMPVNGFSGRENSAFIAGLAYYAHTTDLRPLGQPFSGPTADEVQTASTYWVDVLETQNLEPRRGNMYWLAAKYGGFTLPDPDGNSKFTGAADYNPATRATALPNSWWTNGDTLTSNTKQGFTDETFPRASSYYVANQANLMVANLTSAFAKIASTGAGSGSSLAANSTRLDTNTRIYQALFVNGNWMGQLKAYDLDDVTGVPITPALWTATAAMPAPGSRKIFINAGGTQKAFTATNMTASQKTAFTFTGIGASTTTQNLVDYFFGIQTLEESATGGVFRTRSPGDGWSASLGDIVNSTPIYVGAPNPNLYSAASFTGASTYGTFATTKATRTPAIWVGANDGMLHAFNANTGVELYAFIPSTVIMNGLAQYANPDYVHKYFVDGEMAIADVYDTGSSSWRTILVGTLGRGGPGVFALDVTDPNSPTFLWEKNSTDIAVLGKNIGRPVIAQVADGNWKVIFGNGMDSGASSQLILIGAISGTVTVKDSGASATNNGLSAVLARDTDANGFADVAYAGDLQGNLLKFSGLSGTPTVTTMFIAKDPTAVQPITAAPFAAKDASTGLTWVFFGTGKYLNELDIDDTQQQTWYGIVDNGVATTRANLVQRSFTAQGNIGEFGTGSLSTGTSADLVGKNGWFIELPIAGERMVVPNRFQGGVLIGISRVPDPVNACKPTGRGIIMAINAYTGAALDNTFFDTNRDNVFNDLDKSNGQIISRLVADEGLQGSTSVGSVLLVPTDTAGMKTINTQGSAVDAGRMSWREILN